MRRASPERGENSGPARNLIGSLTPDPELENTQGQRPPRPRAPEPFNPCPQYLSFRPCRGSTTTMLLRASYGLVHCSKNPDDLIGFVPLNPSQKRKATELDYKT